jgi:hypothetical protein
MFNYHKTLNLICIVSLLFTACSENQNEVPQNSEQLRAAFLAQKNYQQVKMDYFSLEESTKKELWLEKLNQPKKLDFSEEHIILIQELSDHLSQEASDLNKITALAVELAKITPEQDFLMMFGNLEDYQPRNDGGFHDDLISVELQESLLSIGSLEKNIKSVSGKTPDCNCSWTCSWYNNGYSNTNCNETTTGCGFLWLQSCIEKV